MPKRKEARISIRLSEYQALVAARAELSQALRELFYKMESPLSRCATEAWDRARVILQARGVG